MLVAVEHQERVVRVLGGHGRCGDPQVVRDDKVVHILALATKEFHPLCRDECFERVSFGAAQFIRKQQLDLLDDLGNGVCQVLLQHFGRLGKPRPRAELLPVVKCTCPMVNRQDKILLGVEENSRWTFAVAAAEFLGVSSDICTVEAEAAPVDCDGVVL